MNAEFWKGKKVLVTGHTGFKGSWLSIWLCGLGAEVQGYALKSEESSLFEMAQIEKRMRSAIGDIRRSNDLNEIFCHFRPEIVIHMAAQPLVKRSYHDPVETYETNVMGTVNLFEAIRLCDSVRVVVNVTTDKVYENSEQPEGYAETDRLGGYDPYSNSKACSELITSSYRQSFFNPLQYRRHGVAIATARAGNVIGGGDWSEDRIVPDMMRAMFNQHKIIVRNPDSIRPWQHVLEPLSGYLMLAEKLYREDIKWSGSWNFGPKLEDCVSVRELIALFDEKAVGQFPEVCLEASDQHETSQLLLKIDKSKNLLGWKPKWALEQTVDKILEWHMAPSSAAYEICVKQISEYEKS